MENAIDALKMAADVLVFVLALSISILSFGEARKTAETILAYKDKTNEYNYITDTEKTVTVEEIIPTIYRAFLENYTVVFEGDICLYMEKENTQTEYTNINYIDWQKLSSRKGISDYNDKMEFIKGVLYGKNSIEGDKVREDYKYSKYFEDRNLEFTGVGIYGKIKDKTFTEKNGVYYQEELEGDASSTPDANKTKKRIITYTEKK